MTKTAIERMNEFWQLTYNPEQFKTLEEFLESTSKQVWKFQGIGIDLGNGTLEEKCEIFLKALKDTGLMGGE